MENHQKQFNALLTLNALAMGSTGRWMELIRQSISPVAILELILQQDLFQKQGALEKLLEKFNPEIEKERCSRLGIKLISVFDEAYPALLKEMTDPPLILYILGEWLPSDQNSIAVVGSRHPSFYGRAQAQRFSSAFAEAGLTVISGLARGIDQTAHEAALKVSWGRTVAVLGSGLDVMYPPENKKLAEGIIERGALISEFPLGTKPFAGNFPRRNRIISGLSLSVLVVEAHKKSGSLITARLALEQGKDVFAIPGPIDQITSGGTNGLIKEGAYLAEIPDDVINQIPQGMIHLEKKPAIQNPNLPFQNSPLPEKKDLQVFKDSENRLQKLLEEGPLFYDEIAENTGMSAESLALSLVEMELKALIRKNRDGRFSLI